MGDSEADLVRLYLDSIGHYRLLTHEEEIELAQAIEDGRAAAARLEAAAGDLTPGETVGLRRRVRRGEQAFERFVQANLRLVVSIAKRYQGELPMLDLIQEGNIGLMRAVEKFDWRRGYKFSTYATWWIRQAIGRGIENTARAVRLPVHTADSVRRLARVRSYLEGRLGRSPSTEELAAEAGLPAARVESLVNLMAEPISLDSPIGSDGESELGDLVADTDAPGPFEVVSGGLLGWELQRLMQRLGDRERAILSLRYGLDRGEPRTLEQVGAEMNLTRERVRQIERKALTKLAQSVDGGARDLLAS